MLQVLLAIHLRGIEAEQYSLLLLNWTDEVRIAGKWSFEVFI
jgi:hypothetical protein